MYMRRFDGVFLHILKFLILALILIANGVSNGFMIPSRAFGSCQSLNRRDSNFDPLADFDGVYHGGRHGFQLASQKPILEKERYIRYVDVESVEMSRQPGPRGFADVAPPVQVANFDPAVKRRQELKKKYPDVSMRLIWEHFDYSGPLTKGITSGRLLPSKWARRPNYYKTGNPVYINYPRKGLENYRGENDPRGTIKSKAEITGIKRACRLAREILDSVHPVIVEGNFTDDIDRKIHEECRVRNVYPSTLNYRGFPKSCCTSINEIACHGIPDSTVLAAGDLVNVDFTAFVDGFHGDVSETFIVLPKKGPRDKKQKKDASQCKSHGMYERNKLNFNRKCHDNVWNCFNTIVHQLSVLKQFCNGLKLYEKGQGWMDFYYSMIGFINDEARPIFHSSRLVPKGDREQVHQELTRVGGKLLASLDDYIESYGSNRGGYKGPILGNEAGTLPNYVAKQIFTYGGVGQIGGNENLPLLYFDSEDPRLLWPIFSREDEDRYHKVHLFSHSFQRDVELAKAAHDATMAAIDICKPGVRLSEIGKTICEFVEPLGFYSFPYFMGHGIGRNFHEFPNVSFTFGASCYLPGNAAAGYSHFYGLHAINHVRSCDDDGLPADLTMEPGMVFTIEPIIGTSDCTEFVMWPDGWTVATPDGSKTAQFEHTILITEKGHEVLTARLESSPPLYWENPVKIKIA